MAVEVYFYFLQYLSVPTAGDEIGHPTGRLNYFLPLSNSLQTVSRGFCDSLCDFLKIREMLMIHDICLLRPLQLPRWKHPVPLFVKDEHPPAEVEPVVLQSPFSFAGTGATTREGGQSFSVKFHLKRERSERWPHGRWTYLTRSWDDWTKTSQLQGLPDP